MGRVAIQLFGPRVHRRLQHRYIFVNDFPDVNVIHIQVIVNDDIAEISDPAHMFHPGVELPGYLRDPRKSLMVNSRSGARRI